jgi:hypothetical protein
MSEELKALEKAEMEREDFINNLVKVFINDKAGVTRFYAKEYYRIVVDSLVEQKNKSKNISDLYLKSDGSFAVDFMILQTRFGSFEENPVTLKVILDLVSDKNTELSNYFAPIFKYFTVSGDFLYFSKQNSPVKVNLLRTETVKKGIFSKETFGYYSLELSEFFKDFLFEINKLANEDKYSASFGARLSNNLASKNYSIENKFPVIIFNALASNYKSFESEFKLNHDSKGLPPEAFDIRLILNFNSKKPKRTTLIKEE